MENRKLLTKEEAMAEITVAVRREVRRRIAALVFRGTLSDGTLYDIDLDTDFVKTMKVDFEHIDLGDRL